MPRKTEEQLAVLTRLYSQPPNPMTGWGKGHAAAFEEAVRLTGLTGTQVKVICILLPEARVGGC